MLGMFCGSDCNTNEEYKKVIKGRIILFIGIIAIGVATLIVTLLGDRFLTLSISEDMITTYLGFGTGLTVVGVILLIKNISILKDEEKIRKNRISNTDERIKSISLKASRFALAIMLVSMYLVALIGGLWYPILTQVLFGIISVFLLAYLIAYIIISKKI